MNLWPGLLSLDLAAMYCSMKPVEVLFQAGCTAAMVSAITGQSLLMLEHYARKRNNRKLAKVAMEKWENTAWLTMLSVYYGGTTKGI